MAKKIIAILLLFCVMLFSFTGCFGHKKAGKPFSMPIVEEPTSLDPQIADANSERLVAANCYEGLVRMNSDGKITAGVATDWSISPDNLVYTFTLREDAHWAMFSGHKTILGEEYEQTFNPQVLAEDFQFGIERAMHPQTESPDATRFEAIAKIETLGDFSIRFTLKYPDDNFLYALTTPGAMPCDREFFEKTNGRYGLDAKYMLCNGPLHVSKWSENASIKMVRNNEYRGEHAASPSSLTLYINADETEIPLKMQERTYDAAFLNAAQMQKIENTEDLNIQEIPNVTYTLIFNQHRQNFENLKLRRAICSALEIPAETKNAQGLIPSSCRISTESYRAESANLLTFDAKAAQQDFAEALLELGKNSISVSIVCAEENETFVKQLVQSLQKTLGVKFSATIEKMPETELSAAVKDGEYDIALYPFRATSAFAGDFLQQFATGNVIGFEDAQYAKMLEEIRIHSGNNASEKSALKAAEDYLLQSAVVYPIFSENSYFVTSKKTEGIYFGFSADDIFFIHAKKS